jgi:hypothetical protein
VLLQGEAGTGKSRLGRELLRRHREVTGLFAQGYPLAASAAFGLWTEAVDPFLQSLPDGEVVELCLICLTLMWLESALGLCLGCKIHALLVRRGWAADDPGYEVCADGSCDPLTPAV